MDSIVEAVSPYHSSLVNLAWWSVVVLLAALVVFASTGRVEWVSGIILAVGMTAGAFASVKFALNIDQRVIKWALFVMVCLTSASVLLLT